MERLSAARLQALAEAIEAIGGAGDPDAFPAAVLAAVRRLIPADSVSYNLFDLRRPTTFILWAPVDALDPRFVPAFERHLHEHPILRHHQRTRDGRAATISDFLDQPSFHRLGLYADAYRPLSVEHQVATSIPIGGEAILGLAVNRDRCDFGDAERALLNLLRPVVAQTHRHLQLLALVRRGATDERRELLLLDPTGAVASASDRARAWLAAVAGSDGRATRRLPAPLDDWVRQARTRRLDAAPEPAPPLMLEDAGGRLIARFVRGGFGNPADLVLLERQPASPATSAGAELGLTPREREVVAGVAAGWSNDEIGRQLGVSERTVEKHMARIRAKLGVRSRAALVALALRAGTGT